MLQTSICDLLEIDYPIVQAPIGSATCPELAAAVSNAGGLGHLAVTWRDRSPLKFSSRSPRHGSPNPPQMLLLSENLIHKNNSRSLLLFLTCQSVLRWSLQRGKGPDFGR